MEVAGRLRAMGFAPGANIEIVRKQWPFPYHIRVGSTEFMVRRRDLPLILSAINETRRLPPPVQSTPAVSS